MELTQGSPGRTTATPQTLTAIDPRVRRQWRIEALLAAVPLTIVATILGFALPWPLWLGGLTAIASLVLSVAALAVVGVRYRHWRYRLGDDILVLEHGV